jgi:hypothetical protein
MSRTYKDLPNKLRFPEEAWDYRYYFSGGRKYIDYLQYPGVLTKKKKNVDTENHWMTTPMWYIREFMNQPQRAKGRQWEKSVLKVDINDLDIIDYPSVSRKPHLYYW